MCGFRRCSKRLDAPGATSSPYRQRSRFRPVEASAFVLSAAQVGTHEDGRETYGHSLAVDPWGDVLLDLGGERAGLGFVDLDHARIAEVRAQLPSLANRRAIAK